MDEEKRNVCANCGQPYDEKDRYCRNCGAPIEKKRIVNGGAERLYGPKPPLANGYGERIYGPKAPTRALHDDYSERLYGPKGPKEIAGVVDAKTKELEKKLKEIRKEIKRLRDGIDDSHDLLYGPPEIIDAENGKRKKTLAEKLNKNGEGSNSKDPSQGGE